MLNMDAEHLDLNAKIAAMGIQPGAGVLPIGMDDVGEDDLILAGGMMANGAPVDESAYKKMLMDSAGGYPGIEGSTAAGGVGSSAIEVKTWIQWYLI
jgi:hypothetical protein